MFVGSDDGYGATELGCEIIDMPLDNYQNKKKLTATEITKIERDTVGQQDNDQWRMYWKLRLKASNFEKVCKLQPTASRANTVKYILYDIFQGNSSTR